MPVPDAVKNALVSVQAALGQDDISTEVRDKKIAVIQGKALHDHLRASLVQSRSVELGEYKILVEQVGVDPVTGLVDLFGVQVWRNGKKLPFDPHRQFLNLPIVIADDAGDVQFDGPGANGKRKKMKGRVDPGAVVLLEILSAVDAP